VDGDGAKATLDVSIDVANVNRAPVPAASDRLLLIGEQAQFQLAATDPDGDVLTYQGIDLPDGATIDAQTGMFRWTPQPGQDGDHYVAFSVSDGKASTRQTIILRAALAPQLPKVRVEVTPSYAGLP